MRVLVTGSSGFIGRALCQSLARGGHEVVRAVRAVAHATGRGQGGAVLWDPRGGFSDLPALEGLDAAVHLAGENIAGIWTEAKRKQVYDSRVVGTGTLCESLAALTRKPNVLVVASAVGFYGDRGDEPMDEDSSGGDGFLAIVSHDTESAAIRAREAGIRTVAARMGIVLDSGGGALAKMLPVFRAGLGGRLGSGRQYMSWIALPDAVRAIEHVLAGPGAALSGPVNVVTPNPATNAEFTRTLGALLHRPTLLAMPTIALRTVLGRMADEVLLSSIRVVPRRLVESGLHYFYPDLESALRHALWPAPAAKPLDADE